MTDATHNLLDSAPADVPPPSLPAPLARGGRGLAAAGAVLCAAALATAAGRERFAAGWLWGFTLVWSVALGGLFLTALHHVTHAVWSVSTRRVAEMFASTIPLAALLFLPVLAFLAWPRVFPLFPWADAVPAVHSHPAGEAHGAVDAGGYLGVAAFAARGLVCFALWIFFAHRFVGVSLRQDRGEGGAAATLALRRLSIPFLILFAVTLTLCGVDWLMSLEPHWFSTIFGVYVFAGMTVAGLAAATLAAVVLRRSGRLGTEVTDDHLYSLGALLFAFTCFWAYIAFSQYMLIWYGNIPEEAAYFARRTAGRWSVLFAILWAVRFAIPFLVLLPRPAKKDGRRLAAVAVLALAGQALDLYWMIMPARPAGGLAVRWAELGPPVLMAGLLLLALSRFLRRHPPVPLGDPLREDCRRFHLTS
jgi:hypothetical protein